MKRDLVALGELVLDARLKSGLSLRALARAVDRSPSYLSLLERCALDSPPSEATLMELSRVLGIPSVRLMVLAGRVPASVVEWLDDKGLDALEAAVLYGMTGQDLLDAVHTARILNEDAIPSN